MRLFNNVLHRFIRNYSSFTSEFQIPTFSNLNISVPHKVNIVPLDVHKFQNCDQLIIEANEFEKEKVHCNIEGSNVQIFSQEDINNDVINITAPVKSNLQVSSNKDISVGGFSSDELDLKTENGNVQVEQYFGKNLNILTNKGNIIVKGPVQSSSFFANIMESGSISTGRLQCLNVHLSTNEGVINVPSSYSTESNFEVDKGKLDLHNIHKSCSIILQVGELNLTGFDGTLKADLGNVQANVQLSRILGDSTIKILKNGKLHLKLSEECQESCIFEIYSKHTYINEGLKDVYKDNNLYIFSKDPDKSKPRVLIDCSKSDVSISSASWKDMIKLKYST